MQTVEFVEALLNLGYSLVQVHPTVDGTNGTEVANWVETLLEQGDIRVAAAGLSEFLSGIEPLPEKVKALQYAGRLVKVAEAVDDPTLDQQVLKAEFLSHLVNLGGAYAGLNPNTQQSVIDELPPLHLALINNYLDDQQSLNSSSNYLESHLNQAGNSFEFLKKSTLFIKDFKKDQRFINQWSDLNWINLFFSVTRPYENSLLVDNTES